VFEGRLNNGLRINAKWGVVGFELHFTSKEALYRQSKSVHKVSNISAGMALKLIISNIDPECTYKIF
jgi:hypothetical protein